jgi:soluble lytic murein transglycosylase
MGQTDAALETWTRVAQTWPQAYYGIIALDRVRELAPERALALQGPPPSPVSAHVAPPALERLRVLRSVELDEAVQLVRMGLLPQAQDLLQDQVGRGLPRDGVHLLATLYEISGKQRAASGLMQRHTRRAARPDDSTAQAWRQAFPTPFAADVADAARKAEITQSLLFAIMRHESGYVPTATSKAGAYGLTQVLPATAKSVAELIEVPWQGIHGLYKPAYNLQMGAHLVAQLLSLGRGSAAVAVASYNAGPSAVKDWHKKWAGEASDAFVEAIPYPGTRAYVMQVLASAQTYAWLYPEWGELERDQLGRPKTVPQNPGPFMQKPAKRVSVLQWP